jgi:hypothetical protein
MEEFLWDTGAITEERKRIKSSHTFKLWCFWWERAVCGSRNFEPIAPLDHFILEGIKNRGANSFVEKEAEGDLCRLWQKAWSLMISRKGKAIRPGARSAKRGMKFCLIIQVLRSGLGSGRLEYRGLRELPDGRQAERWADRGLSLQEASEAASLLLAVFVLRGESEIDAVTQIPRADVNKQAEIMACEDWWRLSNELYMSMGDLNDFKKKEVELPGFRRNEAYLPENKEFLVGQKRFKIDLNDFKRNEVTLNDFKKFLRVQMPKEWRKVNNLSIEYQNQAGSRFDDWMKLQRLNRWFPFGDG